jgi:hypothetical protein
VRGAWKAALKQAGVTSLVSGTNKHFFRPAFTASRLLPPTKSATQAKRQHVLFGRWLLADIALQALHPTGISWFIKDTTKYQLHVRRFLPFWARTGRSEVLAPPKQSSAYGGEPKTPRIWAFLAKPFRTAFFSFFSKSLCGAKNKEPDGLTRKRPLRTALRCTQLHPKLDFKKRGNGIHPPIFFLFECIS